MPGVNVQVKGTTNGTITNIDGKFSISVPNSKSVLIFTFIGYSKQEIVVGNQAKINVQLKEDAQNLDEVVVVGYGTAKKSDLTVLLPVFVLMRMMLQKLCLLMDYYKVRLQV